MTGLIKNRLDNVSATTKAMMAGVQGLAFVIVVMGVVFGDVAFIWLFQNAFPDGIFRIASYIGVFATTLSVIGLFIGKTHWFRPGGQIIWAWVFAGIELTVVMVNTIAAFDVARAGVLLDPALQMWVMYVSPATPLFAVIGWFLITWFSPERAMSHRRMEMQDKLAQQEIDFELATGMAQLEMKHHYLNAGQSYMQEELNAPHIQRQVEQAAANEMADVLGRMTGQHIIPRRVARIEDLVELRAQQDATNGNGNGNGNGTPIKK